MLARFVDLPGSALGDGEIRIGADPDGALLRIEAEMARGRLGQQPRHRLGGEAALLDGGGIEQGQQHRHPRRAGGGGEDVLVVLAGERPGAMVGGDEGDLALDQPLPDRLALIRADRRVDLAAGPGADDIGLGQDQVVDAGLRRRRRIPAAR